MQQNKANCVAFKTQQNKANCGKGHWSEMRVWDVHSPTVAGFGTWQNEEKGGKKILCREMLRPTCGKV